MSGRAEADGSSDDEGSRADQAFEVRVQAAKQERSVPVPRQIHNGDEARYDNYIGNFSQGLPHNSLGEVDPNAYAALLTAVRSGDPSDFANIPHGGTVKLTNPQAGLAFTLQGTDVGQVTIPPSPTLASAERAGEMVEDYWMALTRDVPFSQYGNEPLTAAAIADLNRLSDFRGPKAGGLVTAGTLYRGTTPGDLIGPFVSQFFLNAVAFGTLGIKQIYNTYLPGQDYCTDYASWLAVQNGQGPFPANVVSGTSYIKNGRDLGAFVHSDIPFQEYLVAAQFLLAKAPLNPGNPYLTSKNQAGLISFGSGHIQNLLGEVTQAALKAMWHQKWFVHRTLRPLAYGGLVHNTLTGAAKYPIQSDVLNSAAISHIVGKYGTYLLPAAYPEGGPQHPSYGEGHSSVAGACVTVLKAFFNEAFVLPNPVVPSDDGQSLLPYTGADAGLITVGGELNKLAHNIGLGRDIAGVHWRADARQGLLLGEKIAISVLRDQRLTFNEPFQGFTFTKFDGTTITV
ncbi:MAG: vanadium-dependent haloperoxidase [Gammaproteobacteria bacterium]|nr:vanadium-dependent haloperoxidase [Gammaproteobacteria bacterium]